MNARKVLIVEDNLGLLRGLKDNFQAQGYRVRTAGDGRAGLEAMLRDPPDLVLLDLMLPRLDGYELCRAARSRQMQMPILMLSARDQETDILKGFEMGADDYVTKPFSIREVLMRANVLSRRAGYEAPRSHLPEHSRQERSDPSDPSDERSLGLLRGPVPGEALDL